MGVDQVTAELGPAIGDEADIRLHVRKVLMVLTMG